MKEGRTSRDIYYRVLGKEGPEVETLVWIMGYSGNSDSWPQAFLERFTQSARVVVFDNRGTGRSQKPVEKTQYTVEEMAEDLASVIDEVSQNPVHLIGYSLGGCVALEYAHLQSHRIQTLALVSTTAGGEAYIPPKTGVLAKLSNPQGNDIFELSRWIWELCMSPEKVDRYMDVLRTTLTEERKYLTPRFALEGQFHAYLKFDRAERMKFPFPVTVITGDLDPLTPPENSALLADLIENASLELLLECEHIPYIECPEEFAQILMNSFQLRS